MNKALFLSFFSLKSYKRQLVKYIFTLIIIISGIFLINTSLTFMFAGQQLLNKNFENNKILRLMNVVPSNGMNMKLKQIEYWKADSRYFVFPNYNRSNSPFRGIFVFGNEMSVFSASYLALPYEALDFFGINNINRADWTEKYSIILNSLLFKKGDKIPTLADTVRAANIPPDSMTSQQLETQKTYLSEILSDEEKRFKGLLSMKLLRFDSIRGFQNKYLDSAIIPISTMKEIEARQMGKTLEQYERSATVSGGMCVIVNNFKDVDNVANEFKKAGFKVEYSLSNFENLTKTVELSKMGVLVFGFLIGLIVFISISNSIGQLLYTKRHEVGLMYSLGLRKMHVGWIFLSQMFVNIGIVTCLLFICQYVLSYIIINNFDFKDIGSPLGLTILVTLIDFLFLVVVSSIATSIPLFFTLRKQPARLIKDVD